MFYRPCWNLCVWIPHSLNVTSAWTRGLESSCRLYYVHVWPWVHDLCIELDLLHKPGFFLIILDLLHKPECAAATVTNWRCHAAWKHWGERLVNFCWQCMSTDFCATVFLLEVLYKHRLVFSGEYSAFQAHSIPRYIMCDGLYWKLEAIHCRLIGCAEFWNDT